MTVTITAAQAVPGDIIRDHDGNLWTRLPGAYGQLFTLTYVFNPISITVGQDGVDIDTLDLLGPLELMMRDGQPVGDELPESLTVPKVVEFEWFLHGSSLYETRDFLNQQVGFTVSDELLDKMGRPFYEVTLFCSLDTETGEVKILGAK